MMSRHFALSPELTGAIAKRLPHAKNQLYGPDSFFNQFVKDIYIYIVYVHTHINRVLIVRIYIYSTGWLISSVTSFLRYKISYTQTILVIMVF